MLLLRSGCKNTAPVELRSHSEKNMLHVWKSLIIFKVLFVCCFVNSSDVS